MDPNELIQAYGHIAGTGAALGAAIPFTALVRKILGPAADEIAERIRDEVRVYRFGRQLSLLQKVERMAHAAGYTPSAVPVKLLFSLLEGASLEENEDLHTMWAALLANAAHREGTVQVRPSFADTLKLMTPEVALFLNVLRLRANAHAVFVTRNWPESNASNRDWPEKGERSIALSGLTPHEQTLVDLGSYDSLYALFAQAAGSPEQSERLVTSSSPAQAIAEDEDARHRFAVVMDELTRYGIWSVRESSRSGDHFYLSPFAVSFLGACQPPAATAEDVGE